MKKQLVAALFLVLGLGGLVIAGGDSADAAEQTDVPAFGATNAVGGDGQRAYWISTANDLVARGWTNRTTFYRTTGGIVTELATHDVGGVLGGSEFVSVTLDHYAVGTDGSLTLLHALDQPWGAVAFDGTHAISMNEDGVRITTRGAGGTPSVELVGGPQRGFGAYRVVAIRDGIAVAGDSSSIWTWRLRDGEWVEAGQVSLDDPLGGDVADRVDFWPKSIAIDGSTVFVGAEPYDVFRALSIPSSGVVFTFDLVGEDWVRGETIRGHNQRDGSPFGTEIAADGGSLLVAALDYRTGRALSSAHVLQRRPDGTWGTSAVLLGIGPGINAVAISEDGNRVVANTEVGWWRHQGPFPQPPNLDANRCASAVGDCANSRILAPTMHRGGNQVRLSNGELFTHHGYASDDWTFQGSVNVRNVDDALRGVAVSSPLVDPTEGSARTFGRAFDASGELAAATARRSDVAGELVVFERIGGTWEAVAALPASASSTVRVHDDQVVLGHSGASVFGQLEGEWRQLQEFGDGEVKYLQGDEMIVGTIGWRRGADGTWSEDPTVRALPAQATSVVVSDGDTIAYKVGFEGPIEVQRYRDGLWQLEAEVAPAEGRWFSDFALDGGRLIASDLDSVRVYEREGDSWALLETFSDIRDVSGSALEFGRSVDIDGDLVAIGRSDGAVYLHRLAGPDASCTWTVENNLDVAIKVKEAIDGREVTRFTVGVGESVSFPVVEGQSWTVRRVDDFSRQWRKAVGEACLDQVVQLGDVSPDRCVWVFTNLYPDVVKAKLLIDGKDVTQQSIASGESWSVSVNPGERWTVRRVAGSTRLWREVVPEQCEDRTIELERQLACTWTFVNNTDADIKIKELVDGKESTVLRIAPGGVDTADFAQNVTIIVRRPLDGMRLGEITTPLDCRSPTLTINPN